MTSHRRRLWTLLLVAVLLATAASAPGTAAVRDRAEPRTLAALASVTASSIAKGSTLGDVVSHGTSPTRGWRSDHQTSGAWLQLTWRTPVVLRRVVLQRNPLDQQGITSGFLHFGDGSSVQVRLSTTSRTTVVPITPRSVGSMRFTVSGVTLHATSVALTYVGVDDRSGPSNVTTAAPPDGDVATSAKVTTSATSADDPRLLVDHDGATGTPGRVWTDRRPARGWIRLTWAHPRELTSVALVGARSPARLASATVLFSDGSHLPLGAVLPDPSRPTVLAFMPRVTTSVTIIFDSLSGRGALALSEVVVDQLHSPAHTAAGASSQPRHPATSCPSSVVRPTDRVGLVVVCPTMGTRVGDRATVVVRTGPSYSSVAATVWSGEPTGAAHAVVHAQASRSGVASLPLDLSAVPAGPFTVLVRASSSRRPVTSVFLQLDKRGPGEQLAATGAAKGRTLVYDEEFDRPLSASGSGAGADYASSKPELGYADDFGEAVFADPASGAGNLREIDHRYLRIGVAPRPASVPDTYGRTYVGGLLSSARVGGSGFSAQYAYYEARMLAPAAHGTWPAFWMLPSANLVDPLRNVAEIDAVELYGHNPQGACQTTHNYGPGPSGVALCGRRWATAQQALQWHTYGVLVGPTQVTYLIDGKVVAAARAIRGGSEPLFFMLDLALGGGWPVDLASERGQAGLYVDYVRVYV